MIIVTGSVTARAEDLPDVLRLSREHVERSRREPGCLLHSVHQDVEDPHRLVFLEHWQDRESVIAHFAVPEAREFARAVGARSSAPTTLEIYEAAPLAL
jgi:quinol monooxygenase YgiN